MGSAGNPSILFDPRAERDIKKIRFSNPKVLPHIIKAIDSLSSNPLQGKPLKGNKKGCYSLRIGVYRVIYEIYPAQAVVHIIRIGHRKDIYR